MLPVNTFYVCTLKNVGHIYQSITIDINSSSKIVHSYANKSATAAVNLFKRTIVIFKALTIKLLILTDKTK